MNCIYVNYSLIYLPQTPAVKINTEMKYKSNKPSLTNMSKETLGLICFFAKEPKCRDTQGLKLLFTPGWSPMQRKYMFCDLKTQEKNKLFLLLCNKIPP